MYLLHITITSSNIIRIIKFSGFELTLLDNGPDYFQFIKEIENYTIEKNIERIIQKNL